MGGPLLTPLLLLLLTAQVPDDPRTVLREARVAFEGGSAARVGEPWSARFARDSTDRAAILGLATLARLAYDDDAADGLYRRLVAEPPDRFALYGMLGLARGLYDADRLAETDSMLTRARIAARAVGDSAAEGDALHQLGNVRMETIGIEATLSYLDSSLALYPAAETQAVAGARCRRAYVLYLLGDRRMAAEMAGALELARRVGARRAEAACLRYAAYDLRVRGQEDSSVALLGAAVGIFRAVRDQRSLTYTLMARADVLRDLGAYGEAREDLLEALSAARASRYPQAEALAEHLLGTLHFSLRDIPTAARYFDQSFAAWGKLNDSGGKMMVTSWRANISIANGDLPAARRQTLEAIEFYQRVGNVPYTIEQYQALAHTAMLEEDWPGAARALDRSEELVRKHSSEAWARKLSYQRGRLALYQGELDAAERAFRRYLGELPPEDWLRRHEARAYLADALARRGDLEGAERELTAAGDALDRWRTTLTDRELRVWAFQASASDESDRNSSIARVVAALAAGGRVEAALGLAERRRARELRDRMLEAFALEARPGHGTPEQAIQPAAGSTGADLATLIPDDSTALVEYVTGSLAAPTTAFVVTRAGPLGRTMDAHVLPPADSLTGAIGRFIALVARGEEARNEGTALAAVLLQPILAALKPEVTRLIIVPDGPLHRIPWDALWLDGGRFLVERYAVGLAPSAGTLGALWRRSRDRAPGPPRLLALGDPAFGADTGTYPSLFASAGGGGLPRLRGSGREARTVARYAPGAEVRLRQAASADYLLREPLTRFGIIHLATHALVDDRALARTALALSPGESGDGFVTPGELAGLELTADLVVLSACRTAGGVVVDGEGVQGLTAPLLQAGARSVVATTWRVGDRSTVRMVDRFYRELAGGRSVVDALRSSKLAAMRDGESPGVWAAFTVVGDPLVTVSLLKPEPRWGWWIAGAVIALAGAAGLAHRRGRRKLP